MLQQNSALPEATHQDSEPTLEHPEMIHIMALYHLRTDLENPR